MDTLQGLTGLTLSNSALTSINLEKSTLNACTLTNLAVHNSTITASVVTNCRIEGSILNLSCSTEGSKLYKCKIFDTKEIKDCELHECDLALERCTLKKFPVEVRRMIFELCLRRNRYERGCALIAALRGYGQIYQEALKVFRKLNSFPFEYGDAQMFKFLPRRVVSTIRKITVIADGADDHRIVGSVRATVPDMIDNTFQRCKMLTEVELYYGNLSSRHLKYNIFQAVKAIIEQCRTITTLTAIGRFPFIARGVATSASRMQTLEVIENINYRLGVNATQDLGSVTGKVGLVWRAEKDRTLTWKIDV